MANVIFNFRSKLRIHNKNHQKCYMCIIWKRNSRAGMNSQPSVIQKRYKIFRWYFYISAYIKKSCRPHEGNFVCAMLLFSIHFHLGGTRGTGPRTCGTDLSRHSTSVIYHTKRRSDCGDTSGSCRGTGNPSGTTGQSRTLLSVVHEG